MRRHGVENARFQLVSMGRHATRFQIYRSTTGDSRWVSSTYISEKNARCDGGILRKDEIGLAAARMKQTQKTMYH